MEDYLIVRIQFYAKILMVVKIIILKVLLLGYMVPAPILALPNLTEHYGFMNAFARILILGAVQLLHLAQVGLSVKMAHV